MVAASLIARKFLSAAGASSLRPLRRVPAQHLVSILVVSADVLDGNKATPAAAKQPAGDDGVGVLHRRQVPSDGSHVIR